MAGMCLRPGCQLLLKELTPVFVKEGAAFRRVRVCHGTTVAVLAKYHSPTWAMLIIGDRLLYVRVADL